MSEEKLRFGFGRNWDKFIEKHFNEERIEISKIHLLDFLEMDNLENSYFLDIGCGSGLHSLAVLHAGAKRIVSFDIDSDSIKATKKLKTYANNPEHWEVFKGSILDDKAVSSLDKADIVYSWGVLHHTGDMWQAMDNAVSLMKDDGLFYVALYDYEIQVNPSAEFWLSAKQRYNKGGWFTKKRMEIWYIWEFLLNKNLRALPELIKRADSYKQSRGMALYTDIVDWLGGWPMEFAKRGDVKRWAKGKGLEMIKAEFGEANSEYLFKKETN